MKPDSLMPVDSHCWVSDIWRAVHSGLCIRSTPRRLFCIVVLLFVVGFFVFVCFFVHGILILVNRVAAPIVVFRIPSPLIPDETFHVIDPILIGRLVSSRW